MKKAKNIFKFITIVLLLFIFQQIASFIGGLAAKSIDYSAIDKDAAFAWISVHHIVQLALGLLLIIFLNKKFNLNFNLKPAISKTGIKYVTVFTIVTFIVVVISYVILYASKLNTPYNFDLNASNIIGTLGFQLFLSGPSEEVVFRALPFTVLATIMPQYTKRKDAVILVVTSILFSLAHISWYTNPFTLSFSWFQLVYTFIFALAYGVAYIKSKSVLYPMIMHSISNIIMVGLGYVFVTIV